MVQITKPESVPQIEPSKRLASSIGFSAPPGVNRQQFSILSNFDSIRDNVTNILFFRKGDYPDNPDFGVGLQDYLFDPDDEVLRIAVEQEVRRQVAAYEGRAKITAIRLYIPNWLENALVIDLVLEINGVAFRGVGVDGNFQLYARENQ